MRRSIPFALPFAMAMLAVAGNPAVAASYFKYSVGEIEVTDLGTLGGLSSSAYGINDLGDVVGRSLNGSGGEYPFIHMDGQMYNLDTIYAPPSVVYGTAYAINNSRIVVGSFWDASSSETRPFYYYPGIWLTESPTNASFPLDLTWEAIAFAINNSDRIVGTAWRVPKYNDPPVPDTLGACHDRLPVYWQNAGAYPAGLFCPTDPNQDGLAEGGVAANDINDSGNVVGIDGKTSTYSMFLFKNGVRYSVPAPSGLPVVDPNGQTLHGVAAGVSNNNWVVGWFPYYDSQGNKKNRAYLWDGVGLHSQSLGVMTGGTYSVAHKVNESKIVVGTGDRTYSNGTVEAGFIWHPDFGMHQLPSRWLTGSLSSLRPTNCIARAINERKFGRVQVAGECKTSAGFIHAVRWDITINVTQTSLRSY